MFLRFNSETPLRILPRIFSYHNISDYLKQEIKTNAATE